MNKKIKYISLIIILLLIASPLNLFAYRPGPASQCKFYQRDLSRIIYKYFNDENIDNSNIKSLLPGKEFEDFYNKLLNKKLFDKPLHYGTKQCSYGLTIVEDNLLIYCQYHGNTVNTDKFETMSARNYYSHSHDSSSTIIFFICIILAFIISSVKKIIRKAKNK